MMLVMAPNQMMVMIVTLVMITNDCDKGIDDIYIMMKCVSVCNEK